MNTGMSETLDDALSILKALLQGDEVSRSRNTSLYEKYRYSTDIEELLFHIAGKLELRIYSGNERLFICPEVGSRLFGWSNEEIRKRIPYVSNNSELHMGYFIIMTLITMFYREAYPETSVAYIKIGELVENVSKRLETLVKIEDLEKVSSEIQFDFADICKVWQRLPDAREGISGGKNDKIAFVETICGFLDREKLIVLDMNLRIIYPTDRFKTIIWNYYEDRDNRKDILSFIKDLGVRG